ncbi:hypothetical protein [Sphingobium chungangianum]
MTKRLAVKRRRPRKIVKCPELYKLHDKLNLAYLNGANSYVNLRVLNQQFNSDGSPVTVILPKEPIFVDIAINAVESATLLPDGILTKIGIKRYIHKRGVERIELAVAEFLKDLPKTTHLHRSEKISDLTALPLEFAVWIQLCVSIRAMGEGRYVLPYAEGYKLRGNGVRRTTYLEEHIEHMYCIGCGPDFDSETINTVLAIVQ